MLPLCFPSNHHTKIHLSKLNLSGTKSLHSVDTDPQRLVFISKLGIGKGGDFREAWWFRKGQCHFRVAVSLERG